MIELRNWKNELIGSFDREDRAISAAMDHSLATDSLAKIVYEDGAYSQTGKLPNGQWIHVAKLMEASPDEDDS